MLVCQTINMIRKTDKTEFENFWKEYVTGIELGLIIKIYLIGLDLLNT